MKKLFLILFLIPLSIFAQQIGGAGNSNGYYSSIASVYNAVDTSFTLTNANQWYIYGVRFIDGHNKDFTVITDVGLKYTRNQSREFTFVGTANNESNKGSIVTMQIVINADTIIGGRARRFFHNAGDTQGFNINRHLDLNQNDTVKVYIKTDTPNNEIKVYDCNVTILQTH